MNIEQSFMFFIPIYSICFLFHLNRKSPTIVAVILSGWHNSNIAAVLLYTWHLRKV